MTAPARLAALSCAMAALVVLAGCDRADIEQRSTDATRYFSEKVRGVDYDLHLVPAAADGRGALVVTRSRLSFADGSLIPLYQVGSGVYRTPTLRSRHAARGSGICGGQPVAYLALHQGPDDLYYLNAGNWPAAPSVPAGGAPAIPGACETTAYRSGAAGS